MTNCCDSGCDSKRGEKELSPRKFTCPVNNKDYISVSKKTILQHVISPWSKEFNEDSFYFCNDPECDVTYFGLNGSIIKKDELRTKVGIKETDEEALICYCFGVSKSEAKKNSLIKDFVVQQTKEHLCSCDVRNPSARCCLKDFP